jgi:hypothetical protein
MHARAQRDHAAALARFEEAAAAFPDAPEPLLRAREALLALARPAEASARLVDALRRFGVRDDRMVEDRAARLIAIGEAVGARRYLEIGVQDGVTFFQVPAETKVGVDPAFRFDPVERAAPHETLMAITSDEFFRRWDGPPFDLIYLDGLHTAEQTLRDFCATLALSHARTVWLIDDTVPTSVFAADPSLARRRRLVAAGITGDRSWMGDVFKVVHMLHDFFPTFSYATFRGHGQTVVWREPRRDFRPRWNALGVVADLGWLHFLDTRDEIMNLRAAPEILSALAAAVGGSKP